MAVNFTPVFDYDVPNIPNSLKVYRFIQHKMQNKDKEQFLIVPANESFSELKLISRVTANLDKIDVASLIRLFKDKKIANFYLAHYILTSSDYEVHDDAQIVSKTFQELKKQNCESTFVDYFNITPECYASFRDCGFWGINL